MRWTPNDTKKRLKIDMKNDIEKRWFQGGPTASEGGRAGVQKGPIIKEVWLLRRSSYSRKGGREEGISEERWKGGIVWQSDTEERKGVLHADPVGRRNF